MLIFVSVRIVLDIDSSFSLLPDAVDDGNLAPCVAAPSPRCLAAAFGSASGAGAPCALWALGLCYGITSYNSSFLYPTLLSGLTRL